MAEKRIKYLYLVLSLAVIVIVPQLIMDGEDGNLLVRAVMMLILSAVLFLLYKLLKKVF